MRAGWCGAWSRSFVSSLFSSFRRAATVAVRCHGVAYACWQQQYSMIDLPAPGNKQQQGCSRAYSTAKYFSRHCHNFHHVSPYPFTREKSSTHYLVLSYSSPRTVLHLATSNSTYVCQSPGQSFFSSFRSSTLPSSFPIHSVLTNFRQSSRWRVAKNWKNDCRTDAVTSSW